jgi:hypothetical protein
MPNIRQRKAEAAAERWRIIHEESNQRQKEEEYKLRKKSELISELRNVLSELSKEEARIQSCLRLNREEHTKKFNEYLISFETEFESNPSTNPAPFQIDKSFTDFLSASNLRLEKISEQMKVTDELIQKISSMTFIDELIHKILSMTFIDELIRKSSDIEEKRESERIIKISTPEKETIEISKLEQRIIEILTAKSFLESQVVASVQRMIDFGSNMKDCFQLLETYSNEFISSISMVSYMEKYKKNPNDFKLNSKNLELQYNNLYKLLKGLSEIKGKIETMKSFFSEEFLFKLLFTQQSNDFSFVFEYTKLEFQIKQMKQLFKTVMKYIVKFGQAKFDNCKDFVNEVKRDERDRCKILFVSSSTFVEPVGELLRTELEDSLNKIARIRL